MKILSCTEFDINNECTNQEWLEIVTIGEAVDVLYVAIPACVSLLLVAFVLRKARSLLNY